MQMTCGFSVFQDMALPIVMGAKFLQETQTLTKFRHRLENRVRKRTSLPMVNLIGSTEQNKRQFIASIDDRPSYLNADSGSDLDVMSLAYVHLHEYHIDRRRECCKRVKLADATVVETIGMVRATLSLQDGSKYQKAFDVLPGLLSEVVLGEGTLEEINAFTVHGSSFADILAEERHPE